MADNRGELGQLSGRDTVPEQTEKKGSLMESLSCFTKLELVRTKVFELFVARVHFLGMVFFIFLCTIFVVIS